MKKIFFQLSIAASLLGAPAAQAAFASRPVEMAISAPATASTAPTTTASSTVEAPVASEKVVNAKKLSFFGKLKRYFFTGSKSQIVATLLVLFFGQLGVHRFYLGYTGIGLAQLGLNLVGAGLYIAGVIATATALSAAAVGTTVAISPLVFIGAVMMGLASAWVVADLVRIIIGNLQPKGGYYDRTF